MKNNKKEHIYKRKNSNTKRRNYLIIISSFLIATLIIITGAKVSSPHIELDEMEEGTKVVVGNGIQVTEQKKEYNPTNQLLRVDYEFTSSSSNIDFKNISFDFTNHYLSDKEVVLKPLTYQVSDTYIVTLTENIPPDYQAISTIITPSFKYNELVSNPSSLDDVSNKFYLLQENIPENLLLEKETIDTYSDEYTTFKIEEIESEIDTLQQEITSKNEAIQQLNIQIEEYKEQLQYQYGDDAEETNRLINKDVTLITTKETEIATIQEQIVSNNKRIELLEQSRQAVIH